MKRLTILLLLCVLLTSCAESDNVIATAEPTETTAEKFFERTWVWGAQYVRTDGYKEQEHYPYVTVIDSAELLSEYCDFESLQENCTGYDEAFFEEWFLTMVLLEEPSGSINHEVLKVEQADDKTAIFIKRIIPQVCTDDMAQWHIIVQLKRDVPVKSGAEVQVYLDDRLAWDGRYVEPPKPEALFKEPPEIELYTPAAHTILKPAGYSWTYEEPNGSFVSAIADQSARPIPKEHVKMLTMDPSYAETVYIPVSDSTSYAPTNSLGYFIKVVCPGYTTAISCTKWTDSGKEETVLDLMDGCFYAEIGSHIYEISITWQDESVGYFGSANYYVCING